MRKIGINYCFQVFTNPKWGVHCMKFLLFHVFPYKMILTCMQSEKEIYTIFLFHMYQYVVFSSLYLFKYIILCYQVSPKDSCIWAGYCGYGFFQGYTFVCPGYIPGVQGCPKVQIPQESWKCSSQRSISA